MGKYYIHFTAFLTALQISCLSAFGQAVSSKIGLNPSMVTNESAYGDPGMLVDEQAIASDPLNGAGGAPETNWFPGWGDKHPVSAYIDLGEPYELSQIYLYDNNGKGDFIVEYGEPGEWDMLLTDPLNNYKTWKRHDVSVTTRYLRFTRLIGSSNMNEVVLYGAVVNAAPILTAIDPQNIAEGESLTLNLSAVDDDNDIITYSLSPAESFITLTDNGNGTAIYR